MNPPKSENPDKTSSPNADQSLVKSKPLIGRKLDWRLTEQDIIEMLATARKNTVDDEQAEAVVKSFAQLVAELMFTRGVQASALMLASAAEDRVKERAKILAGKNVGPNTVNRLITEIGLLHGMSKLCLTIKQREE
jgi:hypothetical protein